MPFFNIVLQLSRLQTINLTHLLGLKATAQTAEGRSILVLSSPALFLRLTAPTAKPRARNWPSLVHAHERIRVLLCFWTAFCSATQNAKSPTAQLANSWDTGLYAKHCTASLWLFNSNIVVNTGSTKCIIIVGHLIIRYYKESYLDWRIIMYYKESYLDLRIILFFTKILTKDTE